MMGRTRKAKGSGCLASSPHKPDEACSLICWQTRKCMTSWASHSRKKWSDAYNLSLSSREQKGFFGEIASPVTTFRW